MNGDLSAVLKQISLFEGLGPEELDPIRRILQTRVHPKGAVLFSQGDPGDSFMILLQGSVKVELLTPEGKELTLTMLRPYHFFGELALFDDMPRSATVVALEETQVAVLSKQEFHDLLERHPRLFFPLMRQVTRRLRVLTEDVASLAYLDAYSRVARKLLYLADQLGISEAPDEVLIPQPLTHQELANLVGATRETVTKILNEMKDRGLLTIDQHRIRVLRRAELARALM